MMDHQHHQQGREQGVHDDPSESCGPPIVGMVASAGGLDAFKRFFEAMPGDSGLTFVLIPHLDPSHESLMAPLLAKSTPMPVMEAGDGQRTQANQVYIIPPGKYLTVRQGVIQLGKPPQPGTGKIAIDPFLRSLASDQQECAVCIIMSGTGSHGTLGLKAVKAAGGMAMVQDPASAEYDSMPQNAVDTGLADYVLSPERMPEALIEYLRHFLAKVVEPGPSISEDGLTQVLALLHTRSKYDFSAYRKRMLQRRIERRMGVNHLEGLDEYQALLRDRPDEIEQLCRDLLISVTSFFRDEDLFRILETQVVPELVESHDVDAPLRVWVPGCATGEEAYSIAMLLIECNNATGKTTPVQVFATDVDAHALEVGRHGIYPASVMADVTRRRQERFFTRVSEHHWQVKKSLREALLFAAQNLLADAPFSKLDLVSCRNLLIYLEPQIQQKLLKLFHFALNEGGYLVLGPSENLGRQQALFKPVSRKWRIFRRVSEIRPVHASFPVQTSEGNGKPRYSPLVTPVSHGSVAELSNKILLDDYAPAAVVIDDHFEVLHYTGPTRLYLDQPGGPPAHDLLTLAHAGLRPRIRAAVNEVMQSQSRVDVGDIRITRAGSTVRVCITVKLLSDKRMQGQLFLVIFRDEPETLEKSAGSDEQLVGDEPLVQQLEYELKTTREELHSTIEELESSNEELKASNEEVMSMNEELQSSNEELESSKEELQSLNEELTTVNAQLQDKVDELESANDDMANLITSVDVAILFLGTDGTIKRFTPSATRLFNLIDSDLGRPLSDITLRCEDPQLGTDIKRVLHAFTPVEREVCGENEQWYLRRVSSYRTADSRIKGVVLAFTEITPVKRAELELRKLAESLEQRVAERTADLEIEVRERRVAQEALQQNELQFRALFNESPVGMCLIDPGNGLILGVNPGLCAMVGYSEAELLHQGFVDLLHVDDRQAKRSTFERLGRGETSGSQAERRLVRKDGGVIWGDIKATLVSDLDSRPLHILATVTDISERKEFEKQLTEGRDELLEERRFIDTVLDSLASLIVVMDHNEHIVRINRACEALSGYEAAELESATSWWKLIPAEEMVSVRRVLERLESGETSVTNENHWICRDGSRRLISWINTSIENAAGEVQCFVGSGIDITAQRQAENEARRHLEEASQLQRLQSADQLATLLAHELNQPLASIAMYAETGAQVLAQKTLDPARLSRLLTQIGEQSLHAGEIIRGLRKFVSRRRIETVPMDLNASIRNVCSLMDKKAASLSIRLDLELDETLPAVMGDELHIGQVLLNLLQNAVEAIHSADMSEGNIRVHSGCVEGEVRVSVLDDGPGVDVAVVDSLFMQLASDKPHGLGVGLRIARSLVEAQGGRLWPEPHRPGGIFHFTLPLAP